MQENQIRFIANGWWTQVAEDARSAVAGDGTVVLMGHVSGQGTLVVKTVRPHELWLDSEMPPGEVRLRVESCWILRLRVNFSSFEHCCCEETGQQPSRAYGFC